MSDNKLVLHPTDPFYAPSDVHEFVERLRAVELIGDSYEQFQEIHYKPGGKFSTFIRFVHEHTAIILENKGDRLEEVNRVPNRLISYLYLPKPESEPRFLASSYSEKPICRSCGYVSNFDIVGEWYENKLGYKWQCPQCKVEFSIYDLRWTHAAFARCSIEIWHIHFGEAVPDQSLLDALYQITGINWDYFYYRF